MATKRVIGTSLSTWAAANFDSGTLPATGDTVIVPDSATVSISGSTLDRQGDSDGAGQTGLNLVKLWIQKGCTIDIGSVSNPLKCTCDEIVHEGSGTLYFSSETGTSVTYDKTDRIVIDSPNTTDAMWMSGDLEIVSVELTSGAVKSVMAASGLLLEAILAPNSLRRVLWTCDNGAYPPETLFMRGGEVDVYSYGTTLTMFGGKYTTRFVNGVDGPNATIYAGSVTWNAGPPTVGSGPTVTLMGGSLDMSGHPNSQIDILRRTRNAQFINRLDGLGIATLNRIIGEA